jgi:hypothetical protein
MFRLPLVLACTVLGITLAVEMAYAQGGNTPPAMRPGVGPGKTMLAPPSPLPQVDLARLIQLPAVQKELNLSDDQVQELQELQTQPMHSTQDGLAEILRPGQLKRLKELALQKQGAEVFKMPQVIKELGFTPEQQEKFRELEQRAWAGKRQAFPEDLGSFSPEEREEGIGESKRKVGKVNQDFREGAIGLLPPEQGEKFDKMIGKKVDPGMFQPPQPPAVKNKPS